jgi:hypothetical protein
MKISPADWVELDNKKFQVLGTSVSFSGDQFLYLYDPHSSIKLKDCLRDGGQISLIAKTEDLLIKKVNIKAVKKTSTPEIPQLKVGDVILATNFSSTYVRVEAITDNSIIISNYYDVTRFQKVTETHQFHTEFKVPVGAYATSIPLNPDFIVRSQVQIGDEVEFLHNSAELPYVQANLGSSKAYVSAIDTYGNVYLTKESPIDARSPNCVAGQKPTGICISYVMGNITAWEKNNTIKIKAFTKPAQSKKTKAAKAIKPTESTFDSLKQNSIDAAYRVGARKVNKAAQAFFINLCQQQGIKSNKLAAISELLETDYGQALVSFMLGIGLTNMPVLSENIKFQKMAEEFRVEGMTIAADSLLTDLLGPILDSVKPILQAIPQQIRIENNLVNKTCEVEELDLEDDIDSNKTQLKNLN